MAYNFKNIGERIRKERKLLPNGKRKGVSQGELAQRLGYSADYRQIVAKWESGVEMPALDDALNLCNIFNCELGYLLCEPNYTCKDGRKTDIQKETQLSEDAVNSLLNICKYGPTATHSVLNLILESEKMWQFLAEGDQGTDRIEGVNLLWYIAQYLYAQEDTTMFLIRMDGESQYPHASAEISGANYVTHGKPLSALIDRANIETINDVLKKMRMEIKTDTKPTPTP